VEPGGGAESVEQLGQQSLAALLHSLVHLNTKYLGLCTVEQLLPLSFTFFCLFYYSLFISFGFLIHVVKSPRFLICWCFILIYECLNKCIKGVKSTEGIFRFLSPSIIFSFKYKTFLMYHASPPDVEFDPPFNAIFYISH